MKPLTTITILSRDPMDPETLTKVGIVTFETVGDGQIILTRDEMGVIQMEAADIKPDDRFSSMLDDAVKSLGHLHSKLGENAVAAQHAMTDMFAIHKWLTR